MYDRKGMPISAPRRRGLTQTTGLPRQTMMAAGARLPLQDLVLLLPALLGDFDKGRQQPLLLLRRQAGFLPVPWLLSQEDLLLVLLLS